MTQDTLASYGKADNLQAMLGLTPTVGLKLAAIITFAGGIEHYLERTLWRLRGIDPKGVRPDTDAKVISDLVGMLEKVAAAEPYRKHGCFLGDWCAAARSGFIIRHNIAHGVPRKFGDVLAYMRNPRWEGEQRKREFGDFWAEDHTLDLVREAMATLFRVVASLSSDRTELKDVATAEAHRALHIARSVLGEFASQTYNPSFEKY